MFQLTPLAVPSPLKFFETDDITSEALEPTSNPLPNCLLNAFSESLA